MRITVSQLITFLVIGVACAVADSVTKQVQANVTFFPNMEAPTNFLWSYGPHTPVEAISIVTNREVTKVNGTRFGGRLHTNALNGSITISNLTVGDSGVFFIQIFTETQTLNETFHLIVREYDELKNILQGENVTLEILKELVKELETKYTVSWSQRIGTNETVIAEWKDSLITIKDGFKDILQLNPQNGDLTFIRITRDNGGIYFYQILEDTRQRPIHCFKVAVYEPVSVPQISTSSTRLLNITDPPEEKGCLVVCSVKNGPDVNLTWWKGSEMMKHVSNMNLSMDLSLPLEIQPGDKNNYTCKAQNPVTAEIQTLISTELCPSHDSGGTNMGIVVGVSVAVLGAVIVSLVCCFKRKISQCLRRTNRHDKSTGMDDTPLESGSCQAILPADPDSNLLPQM